MAQKKTPVDLSMETRVFTRCSGGCFFATDYCPIDGWTSPETLRVKQVARELELDGLPLTIPNLLARGLSPEVLNQILIITFPPGEKGWNYFVPGQRWECEKCGTPIYREFEEKW